MLTPEKIAELRAEAQEAMACEQERKDEANRLVSLRVAMNVFSGYKRWYLKRNQPKNYARVTKIVPPGCDEQPYAWICKLQFWKGNQLIIQERIDADTYAFFTALPGFVKREEKEMTIAVYQPHKLEP